MIYLFLEAHKTMSFYPCFLLTSIQISYLQIYNSTVNLHSDL